ncbi:ammonium transporter [Halobacterium bonnevillei]|uniref:Ammonium transporter n=1 Tax=Halobacterium bonnevillei TaxID=2692200 RepID=A0A6B0SHQ5_9EURY|nr:ammonium transporter [Halobacterium bonnevillei]MXR20607.1 ammonium transporter [Halobacterium bonnevillei]
MVEGALLAQADPTAVADGVNTVWTLLVCFLIFFMQPGFAMLEAGQVRAKNVANVLMKNLMDWGMGVVVFFLVGLGVFGLAGMVTTAGVDVSVSSAFEYVNDDTAWVGWLFSAVFAMTAATIVSGAVAERIKFKAYVFYSIGLTAFIYPVIAGFAWGGTGLLSANGYLGDAIGVGYLDFAGATVVHMLGGVAALVGAYMVGPRKGRYDSDGNSQPIPGHSITLAVLGTFILAFGWFGFNVGTQAAVLSVDGDALAFNGAVLGRVAMNTTLGMGGGAVAAALVTTWTDGKPDPLFTASGLLAGLVAVTGAVPHVTWVGGLVLGVIGGAQAPIVYRWVTDVLKIDDVAAVFPVHGSAGAIGTLLIPVFATSGFSATQFAMQAVGIAVITVWTVATTWLVFKVADAAVGLRVDDDDEALGLDRSEHGYTAYPEFVESAGDSGVAVSSGDAGPMATDGRGVTDDD